MVGVCNGRVLGARLYVWHDSCPQLRAAGGRRLEDVFGAYACEVGLRTLLLGGAGPYSHDQMQQLCHEWGVTVRRHCIALCSAGSDWGSPLSLVLVVLCSWKC